MSVDKAAAVARPANTPAALGKLVVAVSNGVRGRGTAYTRQRRRANHRTNRPSDSTTESLI